MANPLLPMLANKLDIEAVGKYGDYWMEPKLDGVRCIATKSPLGVVTLTTRSGKDMTEKLPHLVNEIATYPGAFILDGEIGYVDWDKTDSVKGAWPILDFNATMRVIGSGPDTALQKQREHESRIRFFVFDMPDVNRYNDERHHIIQNMLPDWDRIGRSISVVRCPFLPSFDASVYDDYVLQGGEGVILKNPLGEYYPGKRKANTWYKLKKFESVDVIVDKDFLPGKGKYEGQIGALYFGALKDGKYVRIGKCSGMTDFERETFTMFWDTMPGRVIEIRHFGLVGIDQGGLRHPGFLHMREDKEPQDCLWEDIFPASC